jgi:predicted nuclease of predicted toxin-antitoxin system
VRFLLDECLSARFDPLLEAAGHDAVHLQALNLLGSTDQEVLEAAKEDGRVLISADTDFGELLAQAGAATPSLILLRQGNRTPEHQARTIKSNLDDVTADLDAGAVVVFTDDRIRIRRLPMR